MGGGWTAAAPPDTLFDMNANEIGGRKRVLLSWSSGKDSAWALHVLRQDPTVDVVGLLTTVNAEADRVAMHAVRRTLLEAQAAAVGAPLSIVDLPWPCSNDEYQALMGAEVERQLGAGVQAVAFGDLFLEDIRRYREEQLAGTGLEPLFPLWGRGTYALAHEMLAAGTRAVLTCVDPKQVPASLAGRDYDAALLAELPETADPCGENGEFHTFVTDGPTFSAPVRVERGEVVERGGFAYADLVPVES